jgi:hypothetical protein
MVEDKTLVDREFRDSPAGEDADVLQPLAKRAIEDLGVELTDNQLRDYARSVSDREPFEFEWT